VREALVRRDGAAPGHAGVTPPDDAAREWAEREFRRIEIRAACASLGAQESDFEALLDPLLGLGCRRSQAQSLLEQAWGRLKALRSRLAGLREGFPEPDVAQPLASASRALSAGERGALAIAEESLARAFDACRAHRMPDDDAARLRSAQAMAAAVAMDFRRAAALSEEAAVLAGADSDACWEHRARQAEFLLDHGRELADAESLQALERLCEETLLPMAPADGRADERAWVYDCLGQARGILGQQQRGVDTLQRAAQAFDQALALRDRARGPYDWAATQNYLGNAIGALGQRTQDPEPLRRAITAFEAALEVPASNAAPEARASVQNNLAAVLQTLGRRTQDPAMLERAVGCYRAALATWTPERRPLDWATTMSNLGAALRMLGGLRQDTGMLEKSVATYRAALTVRTRERMPEDWATTQNDLGAALQALGEHTDDLLMLGRAVAAYREAMKEISREREPVSWAMTMANLGVARRKLAERSQDAAVARRAAADIEAAVDVFRDASHPELSHLGLEQLAIARELSAMLDAPDAC
jgi:tetratricopeptide (TPR) repeat protein